MKQQRQQRVAVGPENAQFMSIRQLQLGENEAKIDAKRLPICQLFMRSIENANYRSANRVNEKYLESRDRVCL